MTTFSFPGRRPIRDFGTGRDRFEGLLASLGRLRAAVERERSGLRGRYEAAETSAAFAGQAFEGGGDPALCAVADGAAGDLMRCHERLAALGRHAAFLERIESAVADWVDGEYPE